MGLSSYVKTSIKAKSIIMSVLILATFFTMVPKASLNTNNKNAFPLDTNTSHIAQNLLIKQRNPVVNEGNLITLTAIDISGNNVTGTRWSSGSPDVAQVNPLTGEVTGIKQGFATITATRNNESVSTFVVVTRVKKGKGERVPGDSKIDNAGKLYLSNPSQNVILVADKTLNGPIQLFAGERNTGGNQNGFRGQARFAGPTAIAIDNSPRGGLYITDTLNHQIRKIDFNGQVETLLGTGFPGKSLFDSDGALSSDNILFNSPRGIVADSGGNLYISDTDNHAIYYVDFARNKVSLLAGQPGVSGQDDGIGGDAKFKRPAGLALSSDGRLLTVADQDNNRVRLIEISRQADGRPTATVSTLGTGSGNTSPTKAVQNNGIFFDQPQSVSLDALNNIYVVDNSGVQIVLRSNKQVPQVVQLAQPGVSFNKAVNVTVKGTETFVLDAEAASEDDAVSVVTVGGPKIDSVTPSVFRMEGGADVVVTGSNFAPETMVTFGDTLITPQVVSATEIRFKVSPQASPGTKTFSLLTRGGIAQKELNIIAKPASDLNFEEITTIAGGLSFSGDGGSALEANLGLSTRVALDNLGNIFIADVISGRVRRVNVETGMINTVVGGGTSLNDGVIGNVARIQPSAITLDSGGNIFISDRLTESIRRIDAVTNIVTTVAGGKGRAFGGDGAAATSAGFGDTPNSLLFDRSGNLFISTNNRVRRIDAQTSVISTVVGNGNQGFSGDGGVATNASLAIPSGLALDSKGNLFIADAFNGRVRRVDGQTNIITTVAGNGGFAGGSDRDGKPATSIALVVPSAIAIDSQDNLLVSDFLISRVNLSTGIINIVKQDPPSMKCGDNDIPDFLFTNPGTTMALDGNGNLFVSSERRIRKLSVSTGAVSTVAGKKLIAIPGDKGLATNATLGAAIDVTTDSQGNMYIADFDTAVIRRIDAKTGIIDRFAGVGKNDCNFASGVPNGDGGQALAANFLSLTALATDNKGNVFAADFSEGKIRRIDTSTNIITTFAGDGSLGDDITGDGGLATKAGLGGVNDIAVDTQGNLIIASQNYVRKVNATTNIITTIAGNGSKDFGKDGDMATKVAVSPGNITVDSKNNIFIAERGMIINNKVTGGVVRRIDANTGTITTVAGSGKTLFSPDGTLATNAGLGSVRSVEVDGAGNLFISATEFDPENFLGPLNATIFKVDASTKTISTFIKGKETYQGDGGSVANAGFVGVPILSFAPNGDLLFLDLNIPSVAALRLVHLPKTSGSPVNTTISISNAVYLKPNLSIDGQGFGTSATKVMVNGSDISSFISTNNDSKLVFTGNRKKLNVKKGANQLTVTNSSGATASFQFTF
ncbi:MAG: IPT/TIG domain-containing protein [Acidobacteria bacterium]|nr:IPT/TIG domain-containing protein [Acidobacteriota bacterium]